MPSQSLYLVAQGDYTEADLDGEIWQTGVRLLLTSAGSIEAVQPLPTDIGIVAANTNRTETDWTIQGNWRTEMGVNDLDPADYLNDVAAQFFADWIGQPAIDNAVRLQRLLLYPIGSPDGHVIPATPYLQGSPMTLQWTSNFPVGGGSSGFLLPPQVSVVASHRTAQVGRTGRGRMYLPGINSGVLTNAGLIDPTDAATIVAQHVILLEGLKLDLTDVLIRPAVIGGDYTTANIITDVRVGSVPDTQRRRLNQIAETYSTAPVDWQT